MGMTSDISLADLDVLYFHFFVASRVSFETISDRNIILHHNVVITPF